MKARQLSGHKSVLNRTYAFFLNPFMLVLVSKPLLLCRQLQDGFPRQIMAFGNDHTYESTSTFSAKKLKKSAYFTIKSNEFFTAPFIIMDSE